MNNDINIASRAYLHFNLTKSYDFFKKNLEEIHNLNNALQEEVKLKYNSIIGKQYLYSIFSSLEVFLCDSAIDLLISYPGKIGNLKNDTDLLTEVSTLTEAIRYHATKKINELSYKKPSDFVKEIYDFFGEQIGIDKSIFGIIIEGKATRDLYMHNNGKSNFIYFEKAGLNARVSKDGETLKIDESYLSQLKLAIESLGEDFNTKCISKHIKDNPIEIFKKMWTMSSLNKLVEFDKQWEIDGESIFMQDFKWGWSSSEKSLFNFFKYIQGGESDGLKYSDIPYALYRWRGRIDERIIQSWLESQFTL